MSGGDDLRGDRAAGDDHPPAMKWLCVFAGSHAGARAEYTEAARALGGELAARGIGLVFGGGRVGLMGVLADAVLAGGAPVIGIIPDRLRTPELAHEGVTELRVVRDMHERKAQMAAQADAFIALPGGIGTFEEFFEVLTWAYLGIHTKPVGLLNVAGYYDPLVRLLDHAVEEGFVQARHRELIVQAATAREMVEALKARGA